MREPLDLPRLKVFLQRLGRRVKGEGRVYLTGGASALWHGWREMTVDVDLKADPEPREWFEGIAELKDELSVNVELAAPDHFIPELPGWRERSKFIEQIGLVGFYHYDFYSQALAKLERGHSRDHADVTSMAKDGFVDGKQLMAYFDGIESELIRFPSIDPASFRHAVEDFIRSLPES